MGLKKLNLDEEVLNIFEEAEKAVNFAQELKNDGLEHEMYGAIINYLSQRQEKLVKQNEERGQIINDQFNKARDYLLEPVYQKIKIIKIR
jgi:hypothetical protein